MHEGQCIYVIRPTHGEDLLCLGKGERAGELFRVNSTNPLAPSVQWKVTGLVQPWGWGEKRVFYFPLWHEIDMTMTMDYQRGDFWTYKNGKPRFTCTDIDHGHARRWGHPSVRKVSRWPVHAVQKDIRWRLGNLDMTVQSPQVRAEVRQRLQAIQNFLTLHA